MKYYVTMTDRFLSGWGLAEGKINKLVIECDTLDEAEVVKQNAKYRGDMRYITISVNKPYYSSNKYFVSYKTKDDYPNWFLKNYFK